MLTLANIAGWFIAHKKLVIYGVLAVLLLIFVFWLKACFHKEPKIDEAEILKAQEAVKEKNDARLKDILANADVKEKVIAGEVANSAANTEAAKVEAKKKYADMNTQQLAEELEKMK